MPAKKIYRLILRIFLFAALAFGLLTFGVYLWWYFDSTPTVLDRPYNLSGKTETIDVYYVNWACDCPDFIEAKFSEKDPDYETREEDCIFIEAADTKVKVPEVFYDSLHYEKYLRLTGEYYSEKGISADYQMKAPGPKPEKARVFRYTKFEMRKF